MLHTRWAAQLSTQSGPGLWTTHTFHTIYSEKKEPCAKSIKHGAHGAASIRGAPLPWACDEDTDGGYIGCVSDYELPSATTVLSIIIQGPHKLPTKSMWL